jgi:hypothetical protein
LPPHDGVALDLFKGLVLVPAVVALMNAGIQKRLPRLHQEFVASGSVGEGLGMAVLSTAAVAVVNKLPVVNP